MTKKWDLETSNAETELKIGIYAKNWAKQVLLKNFDFGQSQRSTVNVNSQSQRSTDDVCWRGSVTSPRADVAGREAAAGACGAWVRVDWRVRREAGSDGAWSACSWGRNFSRRVEARVMQFLAVLDWVLLRMGCSVILCLFVGSWMHRTLISECYSTVGVTAVACFWQWRLDEGKGSGRMPKMSTRTRKSEEWLWYHVNNIKWERKTK